MPMKAKEMIRLLQNNGFKTISQNGSHVKLRHDDGRQVIVPYHSKELKKRIRTNNFETSGAEIAPPRRFYT